MSYADDILIDLLSDNSQENDVFFDNRRRNQKTYNSGTKGSENLFGITEEDFEQEMSRNKPTATSTPRISNDDIGEATDDEDLGFDPKKPKASPAKLSIFDDILAGSLSDTKRPATAVTPTPATRRRDERRPTISRQSTDTTTENSTAQRPKTSTGRRGSGMSTVINPDPFGLFSQTPKESKDQHQQPNTTITSNFSASATASTKKRGTTADWLGLNVVEPNEEIPLPRIQQTVTRPESPKTPRTVTMKSSAASVQLQGYDILKLNETSSDPNEAADETLVPEETNDTDGQRPVLATIATPAVQSILQLNNMNLETRGAFALLQQQESQLTLAAQMKQQERALLDMQRKQDTLLQQQEKQFQTLMLQQMQRQQNLEQSIKLQQQRINAHIQLMLTQPATALEAIATSNQPSVPEFSADDQLNRTGIVNDALAPTQAALDIVQIETDVRRLELEKIRLEELVANTKANYEREIELIESTYKKQIKVLDEHTDALEVRLRTEISETGEYYKQKISTLEAEQQKCKIDGETLVATLKQDHDESLRRLRKSHDEDLDTLRDEHRRMLETVQRSKMLEFAAVQENSNYLETLKAATVHLSDASSGLQDLREHLQSKLEVTNQEKQQELEARERRLSDKERRLQLNEAMADEEKARLMKLVGNLEQQLGALTKETSEENWQLRLKLSALEADKAAFERERDYAREQQLRDEKRISEFKQQQLAEAQRITLELQEERRQLQLEKTKFETELKLRTNNSNAERERCEMEATIKCAQEATRQADAERQRYYAMLRDVEQRKRQLVDAETELRARQEKLNNEFRACSSAEQQARDAAQRSRLIEQNYQDKLQALQQRTREVAEKEAFLAEERKLLAQQRITMTEIQEKLTKPNDRNGGGNVRETTKTAITGNLGEKLTTSTTTVIPTGVDASINIVDRMLDENIAESLHRMKTTTPPAASTIRTSDNTGLLYVLSNFEQWSPVGLDDDSKRLALNNVDGLQFDFGGLRTIPDAELV